MAKTKNGLHGPLKGKVGNAVYSSWRGIEYVKSTPNRTAPPTEKELIQRWLFGEFSQGWLNPIANFLRKGFKGYTRTNQGVTAAKSYLFKHALLKDGYNSSIDPSLMLVSYGDLELSEDLQVELTEEKQLVFSWNPATGKDQSPLDQVMLLAYNTEEKSAKESLGGDFRKAGTAALDLSASQPGEYHIYIAFVAADQSRQSNSAYLGTVNL